MAGNGREPLNRLSEYAKTAEQIGLRSFLVTETPATDALAATQHIASITSRIYVGTGIANIYTRYPSLLAGHAIAIDAPYSPCPHCHTQSSTSRAALSMLAGLRPS